MAIRQADGSIRMSDGRTVYANSLILAQDLVEIIPLFTPPPAWPFVSGGGGGGGGGSGQPGRNGVQGAQGPAMGVPGLQGNQGNQGPQGSQGLQGFQGLFGPQGVQGPQGNQGRQGNQGNFGPQGSGVQGPQGTNPGVQGPQGNQGLQGSGSGVQGAQGNQGNQGLQGTNPGVQGPQGNQGFQGQAAAGMALNWIITQAQQVNNQPNYLTPDPVLAQATLNASPSAPFQAIVNGTIITFTSNQLITGLATSDIIALYLLQNGSIVFRTRPPVYRYQDPRSPALPNEPISLWFDLSVGQMKEFSGGVWHVGLDNGSGTFVPALYIGCLMINGTIANLPVWAASEPLYLDPWTRYQTFGSGKDGGLKVSVATPAFELVEKEFAYIVNVGSSFSVPIVTDVRFMVQGPAISTAVGGNQDNAWNGIGQVDQDIAAGSGQHGNSSSQGVSGSSGTYGGGGGGGGAYTGGGAASAGGAVMSSWNTVLAIPQNADIVKRLPFDFNGGLFGGQGGGGAGISGVLTGGDGGFAGSGFYIFACNLVLVIQVGDGSIAINLSGSDAFTPARHGVPSSGTPPPQTVGSGGGGGGSGSFVGGAKIHFPDLITGLTTEVTVLGGLGATTVDVNGHNGQNGFQGSVFRYQL